MNQALRGHPGEDLRNNHQSPQASKPLSIASRRFLKQAREKQGALQWRGKNRVLERIPRGRMCWLEAGRSVQIFLKMTGQLFPPLPSLYSSPILSHHLARGTLKHQLPSSSWGPQLRWQLVTGLKMGTFPSSPLWEVFQACGSP